MKMKMEVLLVLLLIFSRVDSKPLFLQNLRRTRYSPCLEQFSEKQIRCQHSLADLRADLTLVRLQRSPVLKSRVTQHAEGQGGCGLRQVQVKVSELGLGYRSQEEFIFSYCSGLCLNTNTNYDKILTSLTSTHRTVLQGAPPTACCRPTAYEHHLAFLDDQLLYHTLKKHSAKKCGCV